MTTIATNLKSGLTSAVGPTVRQGTLTAIRQSAWLVCPILVYFYARTLTDQYIAILASNLSFLVAFLIYDFKRGLLLERLRKQAEALATTNVTHVVVKTEVSVSETRVENIDHVVLRATPKQFFHSVPFVSAFQLKYISEDTDKFISTFVERIRHQLLTNLAVFVLLLVLFSSKNTAFSPGGASQGSMAGVVASFDQTSKILLALANAALNVMFLSRPYLLYLERNKTHLNN